jgi:type IV secretory pathway VirB6-like protein
MAAPIYQAGKGIVMMHAASRRLMALASVVWVSLLALPAYAQVTVADCKEYAGLTHRMAGCLRKTLDSAAAEFFLQFGDLLTVAIGGALTLAMIVYGIMLAFGMVEKLGRDTFILLMKMAAVITFASNSQLIYDTVIDAMDGASAAVISYTPPSSAVVDASGTKIDQTTCIKKMLEDIASADKSQPIIAPWLGVDCLLDTVIGIKKPLKAGDPAPVFDGSWFNPKLDDANVAKSNQGMARALIFLFFSSMQTSIVGLVLAIIGFIFVMGLLALVVRIFFIYIMGYMGIAFLVIISPLIIPLILFHQTKQYFDKWTKLLISIAIQPVIMLVFLIFTLTAVDLAAFSGKYSIMYRIAGDASQAANFDLNRYLTVPRTAAGAEDKAVPPADTSKAIILKVSKEMAQIKGDNPTPPPVDSKDVGSVAHSLVFSKCTKTNIEADKSGVMAKVCATSYPVSAKLNSIDWLLMAKARTPAVKMPDGSDPATDEKRKQQMLNEVLAACFFCAVVVFVMNGLVNMVPNVAHNLMGDMGQSPNIAGVNFAGSFNTGAGSFANNFAQKASQAIGFRK